MVIFASITQALLMAFGMFWKTGWSLVLGFLISAVLQAVVSKARMQAALGKDGPREITLATALGAASSSCSYASAAISRTLFKKGAALVPSLAFQFASTNLVIELGLILLILLGWQFMMAEWIGGVVLVIIMAILVRLTYPAKLVEEARRHPEAGERHLHQEEIAPETGGFWQKIRRPETRTVIAQNFAMDWRMLWKDLAVGFLLAGALSALVPDQVWHRLFLLDAPAWLQIPANAVIGPLVAVITFVCSIGNVPMAAVLWASGVSFGGVLAFLYADLIVLPLLDVYRRYYGWKMAAYITGVFFTTMVLAAIVMDAAFAGLGLVPPRDSHVRAEMTTFSFDYTFWLNLIFGALALWLFRVAALTPMEPSHHGEHHGGPHDAKASATTGRRCH